MEEVEEVFCITQKIDFRKVTCFCSKTSTFYTEKTKFSHTLFCKIEKNSFSISYLSNGKFNLHLKFLTYVNEPQDCHPKIMSVQHEIKEGKYEVSFVSCD